MRRLPTLGLSFCAAISVASAVQAATITVNAGGNLQAALDAARPGDTIILQAGATFTGSYELPAKGGTTYITIRSSAPDASLPAAGKRIAPSFAPLLAKIRSTNAGPGIRTAAAATNWRLLFLELYPSTPTSGVNLVEFGGAGPSQTTLASVPQHLIIDRCYLHGDPVFGQRRGVALNSGDTQIVNSYFADFKGVSQDTQAILGWNGPGPFLIENNYLEGAGENIMFGGNDPSIPNLVPSDIIIRRNLISKPLAWMSQAWTVKNLVEFKNADTVLVEGNTIENNWAAAQQGYAILFTPRNQDGTAPWSVVRNITVQNNLIRHVAAVFNVLGSDNLAPSLQTSAIVVRNNLAYDVSTRYAAAGQSANGRFALIGAAPRDITIDHNTVDNDGASLIYFYGGASAAASKIYGFALTNNLMRSNTYGLIGDSAAEGTGSLGAYTPGAIVSRNTLAGAVGGRYPAGNDFPSQAGWLADFVNVGEENYQLVPASVSRGAGSDGKNLGVDFAELSAATAGSSSSLRLATPADLMVFRPGNAEWYTLKSSTGYATSTQWGLSTDIPVPGDYDGDGKTDLAVFRPSTGIWYVVNSTTDTAAFFQWGLNGDVPVPADYDGDGKTDIAVFRPSTGIWYLVYSSTGLLAFYQWGLTDDVPVPGDYDGDGNTDIAVFRPSTGIWYIRDSSTGAGAFQQWGLSGDVPVPGDYDGDGKTDIGVFRPSTGIWYIVKSKSGTQEFFQWGLNGDVPVAADYDGDGRTDIAVFRPSNAFWYIVHSSTGTPAFYQWGLNGDVPSVKR